LAARFADEFNLQTSRRRAPADQHKSELKSQDLASQINLVRSAAEQIGRNPADIVFSMSALVGVGDQAEPALDPGKFGSQTFDGTTFSGSPAQIVDEFGPYTELGVSRVYMRAPADMASLTKNFELFATDVLPQLATL
jgi:alkanesulfonate monooxygenase SsuD/methylene tetrahydromethanopterin reductase-like flavin-dependent oxidoreductase (luciferase family)